MRPDPPFEEGADQERETNALPGVATRFWGGEEVVFAELTVIFRVAVLVPFVLLADKVYVRVPVAFGVTLVEPEVVVVERLRLLPERSTEEALLTFQERREEEPRVMLVELAVNALIVGVEEEEAESVS